jgi:hypothetical protein
MTKFARIENSKVVEIIETDQPLKDLFHPSIVKTMVDAPDNIACGWWYSNGEFQEPRGESIDQLKANKTAELAGACANTIVSGYSSEALGTSHFYPSKTTDQINMMGSVTSSLLPSLPADWSTPFWCADENGEWAFRDHSPSQIQQAGADGKRHIVDCQGKLEALTREVMEAADAEALSAVVW